MRIIRLALIVLVLLALVPTSPAQAGSKHVRVTMVDEGHAFCPTRVLVVGGVAVRAGRCYILAVLRDTRGAFFVFMDPATRLPRGQLVSLNSFEGRKIRGRIYYQVPMPMSLQVLFIPVNTIQAIQLREEDEEDEDEDDDEHEHHVRVVQSNLILILTSMPTPDVTVTFVVRF